MILREVKNTIKKYNLIGREDKIVVGVSGGPDSVTLLLILNNLRRELSLRLKVAHLDHMIRKGSDKDAEFVKNLSAKLKIPCVIKKINVKEISKKGSLEEVARNVRMGFLFKVAKDINAKKIALGHNMDDQAETVLMRILRGAGLYGLVGILPKRKICGFQIVRPLIETKRIDIERYLDNKKIKACVDFSNFRDVYFRNRIRNKLLPNLKKEYNNNISEVLSNMAQCIGEDYDYLIKAAERIKICRQKISLKLIKRLHPAILRLVLRRLITSVAKDTRRITFQHIVEIEDLIFNRPFGSVVDLPKGVSVVKRKYTLSFYKRRNKSFGPSPA